MTPRTGHLSYWRLSRDGDRRGLALYERHYSCRRYADGRVRRLFLGPGEKLVLVSQRRDALCAFRRFRGLDQQEGVNLSVFRNEGPVQSSLLIQEAAVLAWQRWPGERLYTYVNGTKIRSANPGFCFLAAGWYRCGRTKAGLHVLEARP